MKTLEHTNLQNALNAKQAAWEINATEAQKEMTAENLDAIVATHFKENAINVEDKVIDFTLKMPWENVSIFNRF